VVNSYWPKSRRIRRKILVVLRNPTRDRRQFWHESAAAGPTSRRSRPKRRVITVPLTVIATVAAIRYTGATPIFVDNNPQTSTIDINQVADVRPPPRTKAATPVRLYGHPVDIEPLLSLADAHHITVIEDAAQAHGAKYLNPRAENLRAMGCFSCYPGKNLGLYGEGGIVVTSRELYDRTIRSLRSWAEEQGVLSRAARLQLPDGWDSRGHPPCQAATPSNLD